MGTTNYNLPTISGASPVAIVDDYNGLANATDAALAGAISGEKTRAMAAETELANGVSNALTTANTANVSASDAKSTAEKAQTTASTALTNAATAQTTADSLKQELNKMLTFDVLLSDFTPTGADSAKLYVAMNADETLYKLYGEVHYASGTTITRVLVPGSESLYGIKLDCQGKLATTATAYTVQTGGYYMYAYYPKSSTFTVGTDGNAYILTGSSATTTLSVERTCLYPACIYINADFGDAPSPVEA